ncbi:MAG TPA: ShlB/FhaC/HecB family hemolysin secretion/activation protein [Stellaceae bacterium]|nr:ShlB/FhaC/HecB family hemolysin secretion/activation protein [Stellaceae bacterium]
MPRQKQALVGFAIACAGLTGGMGRQASAQVAPPRELPGAVEPGRDRAPLEVPAQPSFDFTIEAPQRSQVPRAVEELHFVLNDITIEGAKTIPPERFRPLFQDLVGQDVTISKVLDLAEAIEAEYRRQGYVLTHAYVPPQHVSNGVFTIIVAEGYVAAVSVEGGDARTQALVKSYLQPVLEARPLSLAVLERALLLANDLAGVTASGVLRPSPSVPGASELAVTLAEKLLDGGLALDNRGSQFSGVWTLGGDASVNGLFGAGDQLYAAYASSPNALEKTTTQMRYRRPVGADGMVASFVLTITHGEPGSSLQPFNVVTDSLAVGPRLSYPLIRTRAESLTLDGGFTVQDARVQALSAPFSHDQWRVLDIGVSYSRSALGGNWSASFDAAEGLGIFGATPDGSPNLSHLGAATQFTKLTGTFRHVHPLFGGLSVVLSGQGQYAFAPLVAGEQITFGGTQIGRGYDPGAVTGDEGAGGSLEFRWDQHLPVLALETVEPYAYYDTGKVWNFHPNQAGGQAVASTGAGIRFFLNHAITADFEVSRTLKAVPGSDNGQKATKLLVDAAVRF